MMYVKLIILSSVLILFVIGIMVPSVFAEINYSDLGIDSTSTILFEKSDSNTIVVTIQLTNNSNEEFSSWGNYFFLKSSEKYFETSLYDLDVGDKVCPSMNKIPAGVSKEIVLCFEVPKNLSNSSLPRKASP